MKKFAAALGLALSIAFAFALTALAEEANKEVVKRVFPACLESPTIGAKSGVNCDYDRDKKEWRISYWRGWGDCPAGCINKEVFARYLVDDKGKVYEADPDFKPGKEIPADKPADPAGSATTSSADEGCPHSGGHGAARAQGGHECPHKGGCKNCSQGKPQETAAKSECPHHNQCPHLQPDFGRETVSDPLYCESDDDCFWYVCCQTRPMSKLYRRDNFKGLHMANPDEESCELKCLHETVPPGKTLTCASNQCKALPEDPASADPNRPTVWIGKSTVVGQCENAANKAMPGPEPLKPKVVTAEEGKPAPPGPTFLKETSKPEVKPGPEFTKWIEEWEKKEMEKNKEQFACQACGVCKEFRRVYRLIYLDELKTCQGRDPSWKRVDE